MSIEKNWIEKVAEATGRDPHTIRLLLQRGELPIGLAYKRDEGASNYSYMPYPQKIKEYIGIEV